MTELASLLFLIGILMATSGSFRRSTLILATLVAWQVGSPSVWAWDSPSSIEYQPQVLPILTRFCGDCHSGDVPDAGIAFESLDVSRSATRDRNVWKKVLAQLDSRAMPPADSEQPDDGQRQLVIDWIQYQALSIPCDTVRYAGRPTLRRLNRDEYNRTVRDLTGINFRPADDFPSDDVGYGFDNIGDVLSLPPVLMERYLDAADEVVREAIIVAEPDFAPVLSLPGKVMASSDAIEAELEIADTADYVIRIQAYGDQAGPEEAQMELVIGKRSAKKFSVAATKEQPQTYEAKVRLVRGKRPIAVRFLNDYYEPEHPDPKLRGDRNLIVLAIELVGPIGKLPSDLPESHQRLIARAPENKANREAELVAIRHNLKQFVPRAFRRASSQTEIERYVQIADLVLRDGASFERAMQVAIQAVLVSPHFLFRIEMDPADGESVQRELNDFELATRLSYFLWSSKPDDQLFLAASSKKLKSTDELRAQVRRMLQDEKSDALVENFASQWLQLRKLETVSVDTQRFQEFNSQLRAAMQRETELLFGALLREDQTLFDLLNADYTHVNEPLAKLYGIPDIQGENFQRVRIADANRRGLLGHASVLTVTSNPTRTSPVKRGKWILENLLAAPPPPAPPNVPELEATAKSDEVQLSLKEQMELHRSKPGCAGCHQLMDPLGFGLENFDAIGRWREKEADRTIDASGELPDGRKFTGPSELRQILMERKSDFRRSLATKMLTYALGRGLEYFDECALDEICANTEARGDTLPILIEEIVQSHPFRWRAKSALPE